MTSLANIPSEAQYKQFIHELVVKQKVHTCGFRISWRREYDWCRICRVKIRPKAGRGYEEVSYDTGSSSFSLQPGSQDKALEVLGLPLA